MNMKQGWKEVKLGEVCRFVKDRIAMNDIANEQYVSTENMIANKGGIEKPSSIPDLKSTQAFKKCDVLVSNIRPYFKKIWYAVNEGGCSNDVLVFRANKDIDSRFLYYVLSEDCFFDYSTASAKGTKMPRGDKSALVKYPLPLPPLATQRKIAKILSAIDEKIDVNRRMNENLEEQARAIFQAWFVDFIPFGGKMPEGWKVGNIADLGNVVGGGTPSKAKAEYYADNGISWITPKDLSVQKRKFIAKGACDISKLGLSKSGATLLPKGTVLFSSRAPIGYVAIAQCEVTTNQGFKSVVPKSNIGTAYVFEMLKQLTPIIENMASGSTFKEISTGAMRKIPALIPDETILKKYNSVCLPLLSLQEELEEESSRLASLRDTLLPRLMSGELDVDGLDLEGVV